MSYCQLINSLLFFNIVKQQIFKSKEEIKVNVFRSGEMTAMLQFLCADKNDGRKWENTGKEGMAEWLELCLGTLEGTESSAKAGSVDLR